MRTIIAGSRGVTDPTILLEALKLIDWTVSTVISGTANGPDKLGEYWAVENDVPIERFKPDWDKLGKAAGYIRNEEMAKNADACLVLWDGTSRGSKHMIDIAKRYNLKLYVWRTDNEVK